MGVYNFSFFLFFPSEGNLIWNETTSRFIFGDWRAHQVPAPYLTSLKLNLYWYINYIGYSGIYIYISRFLFGEWGAHQVPALFLYSSSINLMLIHTINYISCLGIKLKYWFLKRMKNISFRGVRSSYALSRSHRTVS